MTDGHYNTGLTYTLSELQNGSGRRRRTVTIENHIMIPPTTQYKAIG